MREVKHEIRQTHHFVSGSGASAFCELSASSLNRVISMLTTSILWRTGGVAVADDMGTCKFRCWTASSAIVSINFYVDLSMRLAISRPLW